MHFPTAALLGLAAVVAAASSSSPPSTTVTFRVPASAQLPNPFALPPATHATLSRLGKALSVPLSTANAFVFQTAADDDIISCSPAS